MKLTFILHKQLFQFNISREKIKGEKGQISTNYYNTSEIHKSIKKKSVILYLFHTICENIHKGMDS